MYFCVDFGQSSTEIGHFDSKMTKTDIFDKIYFGVIEFFFRKSSSETGSSLYKN